MPSPPPAGPAMLIDNISTIVVEPGCTAHITAGHDVRIELTERAQQAQQGPAAAGTECDPIQLAIFSHRQGAVTPVPTGFDAEQRLCGAHVGAPSRARTPVRCCHLWLLQPAPQAPARLSCLCLPVWCSGMLFPCSCACLPTCACQVAPRLQRPCCPLVGAGSWALPSRWGACCSAPPSRSTSRSASTSPARCLTKMVRGPGGGPMGRACAVLL